MKKELDAELQRYQSRYLTQFRFCYTYQGRRNRRLGGQLPFPRTLEEIEAKIVLLQTV